MLLLFFLFFLFLKKIVKMYEFRSDQITANKYTIEYNT